jgi:hypothetical protein
VFILEHYFASKSFAAVREAFSNAYPDKEVSKTTTKRLVTKFWDTELFATENMSDIRQRRGDGPHCEHNCFTARVIW